jgi:cell division protein FtsI/penicillin-binding protein 2
VGNRQRLAIGSMIAVLASTLVACDSRPDPDAAADALAASLSSLDVSGVAFDGADGAAANQELAAIVGALAPLQPAVTVAGVEPGEDDTAAATLEYIWDVDDSGTDWTYTTEVPLTWADGQWRPTWSPAAVVPGLNDGERLALNAAPADRGDILGAEGAVLVTERPVVRIGIDKSQLDPADAAQLQASARALAELVEIDAGQYAAAVEAAGEAAFVEALVVRDDASRTVTDEQLAAIPGARGIADEIALAPTRTFARPLLGTVGQATAELVEKSDGRLRAGDSTGLSGIQQQYDEQLSGSAGMTISAVPAAGTGGASGTGAQPRVLFEKAPEDGQALQTTLDPGLQALAEEVLAGEASPSAIVAVRPSTGDVVAAASGPGSEGYSTATLGQYAPGSTFKLATSLAMIRNGATPGTTVPCTDSVTVDGRAFRNAPTYPAEAVGDVSLQLALAHSCNTAFISASSSVPQTSLAEAAAALGIGVEADPGVPAFLGSVPAEAEGTEHAASMIGQGQVLVSPLALATAAASISKGSLVSPRIVVGPAAAEEPAGQGSAADGTAEGTPDADAAAGEDSPAVPLTADEAAMLRQMMRSVVTEGGADILADLPGEPAIAKTGTAEFGTGNPPETHAWFVAMRGDLAVAVFVEEGDYGSTTGGPLIKAFLEGAAP